MPLMHAELVYLLCLMHEHSHHIYNTLPLYSFQHQYTTQDYKVCAFSTIALHVHIMLKPSFLLISLDLSIYPVNVYKVKC